MEPELTDEEYNAYLKWLKAITIEEMQSVRGDTEGQKQALCRYWKRTEMAGLSGGESIDYLTVDHDSILDYAGYDGDEAMTLMQISDVLVYEEILATPLPEGNTVLGKEIC